MRIRNGNKKCPECGAPLIPTYSSGIRYLKCFNDKCKGYSISDFNAQANEWGEA